MEGEITISEAAKKAETSIFEMEKYLISKGYVSRFSIGDLRREIRLLKSF